MNESPTPHESRAQTPVSTRWTYATAVLGLMAALLAGALALVTVEAAATSGTSTAGDLLRRAVTDFGAVDVNAESTEQREISQAAAKVTEAFLAVDYRDMEPRLDAVRKLATGEFKDQYDSNAEQIVEQVTRNKSISEGKVEALGVGAVDVDSAQVFVAANSAVRNVATEGTSQPRYYRLQLTMQKVDGHWLAAGVDFVG